VSEVERSVPSDVDLVRVGKIVEQAREDAGLSARELAAAVGISPVYLRAIERGANPKTKRPSRLSASTIVALCRELEIVPDELLELTGHDKDLAGVGERTSEPPARRAVEDHVKRIQEAARGMSRRGPFLYERALERLEKFAVDFRMITEGTLRCSPEEEKYFTRLAISHCRYHLRAVSFGDEQRWPSDKHGDLYLQLHEPLRQENVEMTRIFLVEPDAIPDLVGVFRRNLELGVTTYILDPNLVNDYYWRDMVIYDDNLLRTAAAYGSDPDRKTAEFTDDPNRIAQGLSDFRDLLRIARASLASAEHVLARGGYDLEPAE
jgi:transcriptional regulator with XRE-family HTH domain